LIEFLDAEGKRSGTVEVVDGEAKVSDRSTQTIVDAWKNRVGSLEGFEDYYADWTNGYASSQVVEELAKN
jgi:hypothetical protein